MCGICAVAGPNVSLSPEQIAEMQMLLSHRGPDERGQVTIRSEAGTVAVLAHTRLSIVDVATGAWIVGGNATSAADAGAALGRLCG